jgi:MFS family permease
MALLLMPLNWSIETFKWYRLVNKTQPFSFLKSFESVLSGLALSMNTPNRIGEYGGRVVYLEQGNRLKGVALTLVSSVGQLLITLIVGWFALLVLKTQLSDIQLGATHFSSILLMVFQYSVLAFVILTGVFFFRMQWLAKMLKWVPLLKEKLSFTEVLEKLSNRFYLEILFYSFLRFLVFAAQYILIWQALSVDITWWQGFWSVAIVFLIMAIIPSFAIAEVGIRGKVAISITALFTTNNIAILAGTIGIWLLNLALPALLGSLLLLSIKIIKDK